MCFLLAKTVIRFYTRAATCRQQGCVPCGSERRTGAVVAERGWSRSVSVATPKGAFAETAAPANLDAGAQQYEIARLPGPDTVVFSTVQMRAVTR